MGKTIEELFRTKQLVDGKTAAEKYEIRNSKDIELRSSTGAMNLPFKGAQILRRNLSSRTRETRIEEEVTGLRIISKLAGPVIYGTDIFKLSTQKTEMVSVMKDSVNPNNSADSGLLGNAFQKGKEKGLELLNKIGVQLPTKLIPTRISLNQEFKAGKEPDTMATLAKIKGDGAGNLVGKFLAQNAKGTPKQIGNQVLGGGINLLKGEVKKKLFGAPKQGAQNLAKKGENEVQYDSTARYSDTVNPFDEDYFKRNDLSSIFATKKEKETQTPDRKNQIDAAKGNVGALNVKQNPFAKSEDKIKLADKDTKGGLQSGRKLGQKSISDGTKKIGDLSEATSGDVITYTSTVDEAQDDVKLRNDLSTKLEALTKASSVVSRGGGISGLSRTDVQKNMYSSLKNSKTGKDGTTLKTKYGIESSEKLDFLNEKTTYTSKDGTLKIKGGTILDDHDFIVLKFKSVHTNETANFRATVTGISETVSPSWDTAKFLGSPFNYYTYSSIERSVSFNFKMYSTTPTQHIACWQRLNFLTGLAYPQGYSGPYAVPPFVEFTLGNLYKRKTTYIESLSYTMDDTAGWEIGSINTPSKVKVNGKEVSMADYKLPIVIDVSITLKIVESKGTTDTQKFYGFSRLDSNNSSQPIPTKPTSTNAQKQGDANISSDATKVESSETLNKANLKTLNNKEANKETDGNTAAISSFTKKDTGPKFDAFGNMTN
jgi:hypothetical protein